ncbi:hypothetical protein ACA910_008670 [Epithemia clementina (nom. ined.)]
MGTEENMATTTNTSVESNVSNSGSIGKTDFTPTWKLPDGIEDYIESGILRSVVGMTIGGLTGLILFRSGGGYRSACIAAGFGTALGSTYQRYQKQPPFQNNNVAPAATAAPSATTTADE